MIMVHIGGVCCRSAINISRCLLVSACAGIALVSCSTVEFYQHDEIAQLQRRLEVLGPRPGSGLAAWIERPVNNARINSLTAYEDDVPRFERLLAECGGDFREFWKRVERMDVD